MAGLIKQTYGIHLKPEKIPLLIGRLAQLLQQKGFGSFCAYYEYVIADRTGEAISELVNRISTNHTFFMREPDHFYYLRDRILPQVERSERSKDIRIWCAGCSAGQESYTIAMILADYFEHKGPGWDYNLLATDISSHVLTQAKAGEYTVEQAAPLPKNWLSRYFVPKGADKLRVSEGIRSNVTYRIFNLMEPRFPFKKKFHAIFCRNVMIYFDNPTREALVQKFWELTEDGGYLIIGHSESLDRENTRYKYVTPGVYKKEPVS